MSLMVNVPQIAITSEAEEDDDHIALSLTEALTDVEELYEDNMPRRKKILKKRLMINLDKKADYTTDLEDVEASDEEYFVELIAHEFPIYLEDMEPNPSISEEVYEIDSVNFCKKRNKLETQISSVKNVDVLLCVGSEEGALSELTDLENMESETELSENLPLYENELPLDIIDAIHAIQITDSFQENGVNVDISTTANEPPPQDAIRLINNAHALTDVETLQTESDSSLPEQKKRRRRRTKIMVKKSKATDTENVGLSDECVRSKCVDNKSKTIAQKRLMLQTVSQSINYESDCEEEHILPFPVCKKVSQKKKIHLKIPDFDTNFMTEIEDFEDIEGDMEIIKQPLIVDCESLQIQLDELASSFSLTKEDKRPLSMQLDILKNDNKYIPNILKKPNKVKNDSKKKKHNDAKKELKLGNELTVQIQDGEAITDLENIDTSESESEIKEVSAEDYPTEPTTDIEDVLNADPIDYVDHPEIVLPVSSRQIITLQENDSIMPTIRILPLMDREASSEDFEDNQTEEDSFDSIEEIYDQNPHEAKSSDIPVFDGGIIFESEVLESISEPLKITEPLTDTENITLTKNLKRNSKARHITNKSRSLTLHKPEESGVTDVEDMYFSDNPKEEEKVVNANLLIIEGHMEPTTDIESLDSGDEDPDLVRISSCFNLRHIRLMDDEVILTEEGSGDFGKENYLSVNKKLKHISNSNVTPSATDIEDLVASSDDDLANYSRADTATPNELKKELEQSSMTHVTIENRTKINYNSPEEVMYLKGGAYRDMQTCTEDFSDEEIPNPAIFRRRDDVRGEYIYGFDSTVSMHAGNGSVLYRYQKEWGATRKFGDLDSAAKQPEILEAEPLDVCPVDSQFITYESVLLIPDRNTHTDPELRYLHRTTSYSQIDAMLEKMLNDVDEQEILFGLDLDILEPNDERCINFLELHPSSDAIIEIPIKKSTKKDKTFKTTTEIIMNKMEKDDTNIKIFQTAQKNVIPSDETYVSETTDNYTQYKDGCKGTSFPVSSEQEFPESSPYKCELLFQRTNTASPETLSDNYPDSWEDLNEPYVDDDYETIENKVVSHVCQLRDNRTGNDIWWEGTYRNLSIVPEEDEESASLLGSSKNYSQVKSTKNIDCFPNTSHNLESKLDSPSFNTELDSSESIYSSSSEEGDYEVCEKVVKAEVKLLVKTSENGKEAIEIRSVKEFLEPSSSNAKSSERSLQTKMKSKTLPSRIGGTISQITNKFSNMLDRKKSSSYSLVPNEVSIPCENNKVVNKKPSFVLQRLFIRNTDSEPPMSDSNLSNMKEISKSRTELVATTNEKFPLAYNHNVDETDKRKAISGKVDLYANIPFYPSYNTYNIPKTHTISSNTEYVTSFSQGNSVPQAYCDWSTQFGDQTRGKTSPTTQYVANLEERLLDKPVDDLYTGFANAENSSVVNFKSILDQTNKFIQSESQAEPRNSQKVDPVDNNLQISDKQKDTKLLNKEDKRDKKGFFGTLKTFVSKSVEYSDSESEKSSPKKEKKTKKKKVKGEETKPPILKTSPQKKPRLPTPPQIRKEHVIIATSDDSLSCKPLSVIPNETEETQRTLKSEIIDPGEGTVKIEEQAQVMIEDIINQSEKAANEIEKPKTPTRRVVIIEEVIKSYKPASIEDELFSITVDPSNRSPPETIQETIVINLDEDIALQDKGTLGKSPILSEEKIMKPSVDLTAPIRPPNLKDHVYEDIEEPTPGSLSEPSIISDEDVKSRINNLIQNEINFRGWADDKYNVCNQSISIKNNEEKSDDKITDSQKMRRKQGKIFGIFSKTSKESEESDDNSRNDVVEKQDKEIIKESEEGKKTGFFGLFTKKLKKLESDGSERINDTSPIRQMQQPNKIVINAFDSEHFLKTEKINYQDVDAQVVGAVKQENSIGRDIDATSHVSTLDEKKTGIFGIFKKSKKLEISPDTSNIVQIDIGKPIREPLVESQIAEVDMDIPNKNKKHQDQNDSLSILSEAQGTYIKFSDDELTYRDIPETISGVDEEKPKMITKTVTFKEQETQESESEIPLKVKIVQLSDELREYPLSLVNIRSTNSFLKNEIECFHDVRPLIIEIVDESSVDTDLKNQIHPNYTEITIPKEDDSASSSIGVKSKGIKGFFGKRAKSKDRDKPDSQEMRSIRTDNNEKDIPNEGEDANGLKESESYLNSNMISLKDGTVLSDKESIIEERPVMTENVEKDIEESLSDRNEPKANSKDVKSKGFLSLFGKRSKSQERDKQDQRKIKSNRKGDSKEQKQTAVSDNVVKEMNSSRNFLETEISFYHDAISSVVSPSSKQTGCLPSATRIISTETETDAEKNTISSFSKKEVKNVEMKHMFENRNESQERDKSEKRSTETCQTDNIIHQMQNITVTDRGHHYIEGSGKLEMNEAQLYIDKGLTTMKAEPISTTGDTKSKSFMGLFGKKAKSQERGKPELQQSTPATVDDSIIDTTIITSDKITQGTDDSKIFLDQEVQIYHDVKLFPERDQESKDMSLNEDVLLIQSPNVDIIRVKNQTVSSSVCSKPEDTTNRGMSNLFDKISKSQEREELEEKKSIQEVGSAIDQHCRDAFVHSDNEPSKLHQNVANSSERGVKLHYEVKEGKTVPESDIINHIEPIPSDGSFVPTGMVETGAAAAPSDKVILGTCHEHAKRKGMMSFFGKRPKSQERDKSEQYETKLTDTGVNFDLGSEDTIARDTQLNTDSFLKKEIEFYHNAKFETDEIKISEKMEPSQEDQMLSISTDIDNEKTQKKSTKKLKSVSRSKEVIAKGLINLFGKKANSQDREIPELAEPEKRDRTVLDEGMSLCESVNIDHSEVFPKEKLGVHHESEILIKDNVVLESSSTTIDETKIGKLSDKQKPVVSNVEMKGKGLMRLFGKMPKSQEHERADLQELKSTTDHENLTDLQEMIISPDKIPKYLNNSANFLKIEMELYEDNQSVHIYKLPILEVPSTNIVMDKRVSAKVVSETKTVKGKGILGLFSKRGKSQERDISKQEPKSTSTDSHVDNICQPITLPGNVLHIQKETEDFLKIEVQQYDDVKVVDMERIGKPVSEKETRSVDLTTVAGQVTEVETGIILDKRRVPAKLSDDGVRASQYIGDTSHFLNEEILKRPSEPKTVMEKSKQDEKKSEAVQIRIKNELEKGETTKISKSRGIIGLFSKSDSLKETSERNESLGNEVVGTDGATVNVETSVNQHLQYNHTHEALIRNIESCNNFLNHEVTLHHDKNIFSNKVVTKRSKGKTILEFFGKRPKSEDRDRTNVLTEKCNTLPRSVSVSPRKQTQTIPTPSGPLSCTVMADIDASGSFFGKENDISSNSKLLPEKTDHQYRSIVETLEKSPKSEEFQSGKTREKDEGIMATNGNNSETFNIPKTVYVPNATESKPSTFDVIDESRNFLKFETDFYYDFGIVSADSDINILNDQKEKKGKGLIGLFGSRNKSQNRAKKDTVLTSEGNKNEKVSNEAVNDVTDRKTSKGFLSLFTKRGKTHDKENYPKEDSLPMEYSIQFDEADSNKRTILQNRLSSTHNTDAILDGIQVEGSIDNGNNNAELSEPILQETSCTYNLDGSEYISDYVGHLIDNRIIQEHEVETSSVDGLYSARSSEFKVDEKYSPETNSDDAFTFIKEEVEKFESTKLASTDLLDSSFRVDTTVEKVVEDGIDKDIIIKKITITEKLIEKRPRSEKDIIIPSVAKDSAELIPKSNEESKSVDKVFEQMEYTNRFISNEVDNYQDVRPIVKQEVITVPKDEKKGSSIFVLFGKKKSQDHDENRTDRNSRFTAGEEKSATKGRSKSSSPFRIFTKKQSRSGEKSEKLQLSEDTLKTLSETTSFLNTEINCYNDVKITSEPTDSGSIISAIYVPSECIEGMTHSFNLTQSMATPSHIPVTEAERPIEEGVGKSHGILSIFGKKSKEDSSDFAVKKVKKHHKQLSIEQTEEMHIEEATEGINIVESAQCDLVEDVSNLEAKEIGFGIIKPKVKITDLDENFPSTPEVPKSNLNIESEQKSKKGFFAKISEKLTGKSNELQGKVVNIDSPIEDKIKTQTLEITADTPYVSKEENGSNIRSSNIELKTSDFFTEMLDKFDSKLEDVKVSVQNVSVSDTADHFTGRNVKSIAQIPVDIENDMTTVIPEGYNAMITEYQTNEDMEQDSKIPTTSTTEITKLMMPSYSGDLDVVQSLSNQEHREKMIVSVDEHLGEMLKTGTNVIRANEGELEDQRIHLIKVAKLETQSEIPTVRPTIVCKETYVGTQGTDIIDRSASEVIDICDPTIDTSVILIGEPTKTSGHTISEIKTDDHKLNGTRKTEEIKPLNIEEHDQYSASKDQNNVDMASKKPKSFFSKLGKKLGGKKDKVTEDKQCKVKRTVLPESYIGEPTKSAEVIGTFGKNLREAEAAKDTKPIGIETTGHADVIDIANQVPNIIQVTEEFVENLKVHYIPETQHYVSNKFLDSHVKSNVYNTMTRTVSDIGGNLEKIDDDKGHKISETNIDLSTLPSDLDEFVPKRGKLTATKSDSSSYVTSPTMEIGTTSKRYTEIPVVKEISQFSLDDSDEESQMVAEPNIPSLKIHKSELVEESEDDSGTKRKPLFRLESEEDDAHDNLKLIERRLSSSSNVLETLTDNKLEILLTDLDIQLGENLTKATIVTDQVTKSNTSDDSTDADREQANEKKGIESDVDLIEQKLRDIDRALDGLEEIDKLMNKDDSDKKETKLRRVERKFERMASEAMDKEIQNGKEEKLSTPELEVIGNKEFQQLVSQMSHEEVRDSEQEYTNLWDEYTYSKSDDWNSKTPDSQADVLELPQGDIVYMGPVNLNKDTLVNKAGIEVDIIPINRSPYSSPKFKKRNHHSKSEQNFQIGKRRIIDNDCDSLPDLKNSIMYGAVLDKVMRMSPNRFLRTSSTNDSLQSLTSLCGQTATDSIESVGSDSKGLIMNAVVDWLSKSQPLGSLKSIHTVDDLGISTDLYGKYRSYKSEYSIPHIFISNDSNIIKREFPKTSKRKNLSRLETSCEQLTEASHLTPLNTITPQPKPRNQKLLDPLLPISPQNKENLHNIKQISPVRDDLLDEFDQTENSTYSDKKKFWETVSKPPSTRKRLSLHEVPDSDKQNLIKKRISIHEICAPPVAKPRATQSLYGMEIQKKDTPFPLSDVQSVDSSASESSGIIQTELSKISGSEASIADDELKIMTEYQAAFLPPSDRKPSKRVIDELPLDKSDSTDSELDIMGEDSNQTGDNTGYISDSGDVEQYISDSEIEDRVPQIRERQMSVFAPVTVTRKAIYERSASLPTEDLYEVSARSTKLRKQYYEEQIKKEMIEEQLISEIEEEPSPERKSLTSLSITEEDSFGPKDNDDNVSHINTSNLPAVVDSAEASCRDRESTTSFVRISEGNITEEIPAFVKDRQLSIGKKLQDLEENQIDVDSEAVNSYMNVDEKTSISITEQQGMNDIENFIEITMDESIKTHQVIETYKDAQSNEHVSIQNEPHIPDTQNIIDAAPLPKRSPSISSERSDEQITDTQNYKNESNSRLDSMEVHVDKSEIEDSEKLGETDQDLTDLEVKSLNSLNISEASMKQSQSYEDNIPEITVTLSGKQRRISEESDEYADKEVQEIISPIIETSERNSPVNLPEEHTQDIIWEVSVQSQPCIEEKVTAIIPDAKVSIDRTSMHPNSNVSDVNSEKVIEKEDDLSSVRDESDLGSEIHQDHSDSYASDKIKSESQTDIEKIILDSLHQQKVDPDEARKIATALIGEIEAEIQKMDSLSTVSGEKVNTVDSSKIQVSYYLRQLAEAKGLDEREVELVESVLARRQRELSKLARGDTQASSMEITDEELRYSGGDTDYTHILEQQMGQLEAEKTDNLKSIYESLEEEQNEHIKSKTYVIDKKYEERTEESLSSTDNQNLEDNCITSNKQDSRMKNFESIKAEKSHTETKDTILEEDETISDSLVEEIEQTKFQSKIDMCESLISESSNSKISMNEQNTSEIEVDTKIHLVSQTKDKHTSSASHHSSEMLSTIEDESKSSGETHKKVICVEQDQDLSKLIKSESRSKYDASITRREITDASHIREISHELDGSEIHRHLVTEKIQISESVVLKDQAHAESETYISQILQDVSGEDLSESRFETQLDAKEQTSSATEPNMDRTSSTDSKSSIESGKSPEELFSSCSSGRKGDSDVHKIIGKTGVIMRKSPHEGDMSSSSSNLKPDRKSAIDLEAYSSSGESHYHSFELDSGKSRPCSSDVEGLIAAGSSEYESALTSQDISRKSHITSPDYHTAVSSLSSKESMKSFNSESSGNLASIEVSEASETLVATSDLEGDIIDSVDQQLLEDTDAVWTSQGQSPIRQSTELSDSEIAIGESMDVSEEDLINDKQGIDIQSKMKRSHEMTFQPEPEVQYVESPQIETHDIDEKFGSSLDEGSALSVSLSSTSSAQLRTVIELSRTESGLEESMTTSEPMSIEDLDNVLRCSRDNLLHQTDSFTSMAPVQTDVLIESVTIMSANIAENGTVSACTQVTSDISKRIDDISTSNDKKEDEPRKKGHRRQESTSFVPSLIKMDVEQQKSQQDRIESEKFVCGLSIKEGKSDERKDIDEKEKDEDSETEADRAPFRNSDITESDNDTDFKEVDNLDISRPQSRFSKSDSERPTSAVFSDDRPDSELAELLKLSSETTDATDPIDRPSSPEPCDEEIKGDMPELSSEAQTIVDELEREYITTIVMSQEMHSTEYRKKIGRDKDISVPKEPLETRDSHGKSSTTSSEKSSFEEAEAEAAFSMVAHVSPAHKVKQICPILEDEDAEKHELETRERAQKEYETRRIQIRDLSPGTIPDIKVTQHMAPLMERNFRYPDLEIERKELEEQQKSTPETPASNSSKSSEDTDQGQEYVLDESTTTILEESEEIVDEKVILEPKSEVSTVIENTLREETDKETDSPNSDSFEMLEKPDLIDDFVVIEEVGKEAREFDSEGKSMKIQTSKRSKKHDDDVEQYLPHTAPTVLTKKNDGKYYPDGSSSDELGFEFEESPPLNAASSEEDGSKDYISEYNRELEANKKWIEQQFQGDQAAMAAAGYIYEMDFDRGPLEDIKEEDINDFDLNSSRIGSLGSQKESGGSLGSVKDSYSSTPEYDVLAGRKYFTRSGEHDDVSMSSLQEFENLERAMSLETKKCHHGSQDSSSNGSFKTRYYASKNAQGEEISASSLKEFEGLEKACIAAHTIEVKVKEEEAMLSQIDEAPESIASESESCGTVSGTDKKVTESDEEDYEKRMFEIDEIIRQAQTNVERFTDIKEGDKTESLGRGDSVEEVSRVPDLDLDAPLIKTVKVQWRENEKPDPMITSTDSLDNQQERESHHDSTDSLDQKTSAQDLMTASTDSIEFNSKRSKNTMMTDSIEFKNGKNYMITSDSLELKVASEVIPSTDSLDEDEARIEQDQSTSSTGRDFSSYVREDVVELHDPPMDYMLGSTDSLEPSSSTATHATYQYETDSVFSGSFTSAGSITMVSSTDNVDPGPGQTTEGVDVVAAVRKVWFDEGATGSGRSFTTEYFDDNSKPYVTEMIEPCEEEEYSHTIHRRVELPPEVRKVTFYGTDADERLKQFIRDFEEGEEVQQTEEVDSAGNVHTKKIVQKRFIVSENQIVPTATLVQDSRVSDSTTSGIHGQGVITETVTGSDGSKTLHTQQFNLLESSVTVLTKPVTGDEASSISTPRDSSSLRAQASRRRPLRYDISVDDQIEVDPREHDWRFNLHEYGATDDVTTGQVSAERTSQPRIPADQHQLSDEMKQLLEEMEKESKHQ